jgi:AGCS family alanine or glycine:cation symporter
MDFMSTFGSFVIALDGYIWSWPLVIFFVAYALAVTLMFRGIQFRHFFTSWRYVFQPDQKVANQEKQISPLQAFMGAISTTLGNGSVSGMAIAMFLGGPGAAFWIWVFGFLMMPVRFTEVLASTLFTTETEHGTRGGPMVYLARVAGKALPVLYAFSCLLVCFISGNAMQCNTMMLGVTRMTGMADYAVGFILLLFLVYVVGGGSRRIIAFADRIAPLKVVLYLLATGLVLLFFWSNLFSSLALIVSSAFSTQAIAGGLLGHTMQNAIQHGLSKSLNASEAGLGTVGIFFGATKGTNPLRAAIMSMASAFLTAQVCVITILAIVMSGVWNSGLTSNPLVMATYSTVFGTSLGGWVAVLLSLLFGIGVLVGYAFLGRECWLYLTNGRWEKVFMVIYCCMPLIGVKLPVDVTWAAVGIVNAGAIFCNLVGLAFLLPLMKARVREYEHAPLS